MATEKLDWLTELARNKRAEELAASQTALDNRFMDDDEARGLANLIDGDTEVIGHGLLL